LAGERASLNGTSAVQLPSGRRRVPVYAAASGPGALHIAGAVADGVFVNYGLQREHVAHALTRLAEGAAQAGRDAAEVDTWWIACLDCAPTREAAYATLGNILGFVGAYILGPAPAARRARGGRHAADVHGESRRRPRADGRALRRRGATGGAARSLRVVAAPYRRGIAGEADRAGV